MSYLQTAQRTGLLQLTPDHGCTEWPSPLHAPDVAGAWAASQPQTTQAHSWRTPNSASRNPKEHRHEADAPF